MLPVNRILLINPENFFWHEGATLDELQRLTSLGTLAFIANGLFRDRREEVAIRRGEPSTHYGCYYQQGTAIYWNNALIEPRHYAAGTTELTRSHPNTEPHMQPQIIEYKQCFAQT